MEACTRVVKRKNRQQRWSKNLPVKVCPLIFIPIICLFLCKFKVWTHALCVLRFRSNLKHLARSGESSGLRTTCLVSRLLSGLNVLPKNIRALLVRAFHALNAHLLRFGSRKIRKSVGLDLWEKYHVEIVISFEYADPTCFTGRSSVTQTKGTTMPKMVKIADSTLENGYLPMPLRVTHRQFRNLPETKSGTKRVSGPSLRVKCGCCSEAIEFHHILDLDHQCGTANSETIEIAGVLGTVDQWRQVLLPLLGIPIPESSEMHYQPEADVLKPFVKGEAEVGD